VTRYELLDRIGVGGMAEIFRGKAVAAGGFEKPVAIKRILPHLSQDPRFVELLIAEAKVLSLLKHRNIVQIFDVGLGDDGKYFLVMEFVDGKDLGAVQRGLEAHRRRMPFDLVLHLGGEICEALEHAHSARAPDGKPMSLVHRDVSPSNVLLSRAGEIKLTDFGIAKRAEQETGHGAVRGKFAYISPEQARNEHLDPRSDIFSVGILLWELMTGRRLFSQLGDLEALRAVREPMIQRPSEVDRSLPAEVDALVMSALAKDPARRFATAGELGAKLRALRYSLEATVGDPATELAKIIETAEEFERQSAEKVRPLRPSEDPSEMTAFRIRTADAFSQRDIDGSSIVHARAVIDRFEEEETRLAQLSGDQMRILRGGEPNHGLPPELRDSGPPIAPPIHFRDSGELTAAASPRPTAITGEQTLAPRPRAARPTDEQTVARAPINPDDFPTYPPSDVPAFAPGVDPALEPSYPTRDGSLPTGLGVFPPQEASYPSSDGYPTTAAPRDLARVGGSDHEDMTTYPPVNQRFDPDEDTRLVAPRDRRTPPPERNTHRVPPGTLDRSEPPPTPPPIVRGRAPTGPPPREPQGPTIIGPPPIPLGPPPNAPSVHIPVEDTPLPGTVHGRSHSQSESRSRAPIAPVLPPQNIAPAPAPHLEPAPMVRLDPSVSLPPAMAPVIPVPMPPVIPVPMPPVMPMPMPPVMPARPSMPSMGSQSPVSASPAPRAEVHPSVPQMSPSGYPVWGDGPPNRPPSAPFVDERASKPSRSRPSTSDEARPRAPSHGGGSSRSGSSRGGSQAPGARVSGARIGVKRVVKQPIKPWMLVVGAIVMALLAFAVTRACIHPSANRAVEQAPPPAPAPAAPAGSAAAPKP